MRCERSIIVTKEKRNTHEVSVGKLKIRDLLEDPGIDRRIIVHLISKQIVCRTGIISHGTRKIGGLL
jgi:hypothetical protein